MKVFSHHLKKVSLYMSSHFVEKERIWRDNHNYDEFLLILAACFILIAAALYFTEGLHAAFFPLHDLGNKFLPEYAWANITFTGDTLVALSIALLFIPRYPQLTIALFIGALLSSFIVHGLKDFLHTQRPPGIFKHELFNIIGPIYSNKSTPSGHTVTAFTLAGILSRCLSNSGQKSILILAALLISWSRIVCGIHWPVDVCLGAALGLFSAWLGCIISDQFSLNLLSFTLISIFLIICALLLIVEDGGFQSTKPMSLILSTTTIIYFMLTFYNNFKNALRA